MADPGKPVGDQRQVRPMVIGVLIVAMSETIAKLDLLPPSDRSSAEAWRLFSRSAREGMREWDAVANKADRLALLSLEEGIRQAADLLRGDHNLPPLPSD